MAYILRRNNWGEESTKWVLKGINETLQHFETDIPVSIINKDEAPVPVDDWCIRWATTSSVPGDPKVINKAKAIHKVYNKGIFRQELSDHGLAPKTVIDKLPTADMYPVVIRPMNHSRSDDLFIAHDVEGAKETLKEIKGSFYCSTFIDKDHEYRVFVVSGRVVGVAEKIPNDEAKDDVSWGCVGNGVFKYIRWSQWPIDIVKKACEAMKLSGLDFGAVDVILKDQTAYVLEINTGPDLGEYWGHQIGIGIAHILETGSRDFIEPGSKVTNPYSWMHPAVSDNAIME